MTVGTALIMLGIIIAIWGGALFIAHLIANRL